MGQNSKKVVISPKYNKPKSITLRSPNIDDSYMLSKKYRLSHIYVTPEKDNTNSNISNIINKDTESEELVSQLQRNIYFKKWKYLLVFNSMNQNQQILMILVITYQKLLI